MNNLASIWLSTLREWKGMSMSELAFELRRRVENDVKVSSTTISEAEKGYASPKTWILLAQFFQWPIDFVLWAAGELGNMAPSKDELIEKIEDNLNELPPDVRKKLVRDLGLDK